MIFVTSSSFVGCTYMPYSHNRAKRAILRDGTRWNMGDTCLSLALFSLNFVNLFVCICLEKEFCVKD